MWATALSITAHCRVPDVKGDKKLDLLRGDVHSSLLEGYPWNGELEKSQFPGHTPELHRHAGGHLVSILLTSQNM